MKQNLHILELFMVHDIMNTFMIFIFLSDSVMFESNQTLNFKMKCIYKIKCFVIVNDQL